MLKAKKDSSLGIFETGRSYLSTPGPALTSLTFGQLVNEAAKKWGNFECFNDVPANMRLTFSQLKVEVDNFSSGLLKIGLNKGDRIAIWGPSSCQWIISFLAAAKIGIIVVPLSPSYEALELVNALNHLSIKCLVLAEPVKEQNFYKILTQALPDMKILNENNNENSPIITSAVAPHLNILIYMGIEQLDGTWLWKDVQKMGSEAEGLDKMTRVAQIVQFDDILYTPFTSGTTGKPKGAIISHHAQIHGALRIGKCWRLIPEDRHCLTVPLSHLYGVLVGILFPICFGCSVVIPSSTFSPSAAIKNAAKEKCTWLHGTPTIHSDIMNVPGFDQLDLSSLKAASIGAASSAKTLLAQVKQKFGISRIAGVYGLTETNLLTSTRPTDSLELVLTSVGYPLENTELKIVDADGKIVPVGQTGEICSRNCSVMQGYWEDLEKTREAIDSARWYHTGDAGYFLESGHLVLVGRFKDILIRGGENIYPNEIEDFLYNNLPAEQVHVFGVSDERLGEVVAAWILPKPGVTMDTDQVKKSCAGKISRSKIPVHIKIVQSRGDFPRTSVGKVQKNVMRQQYEKELGLNIGNNNNVLQ